MNILVSNYTNKHITFHKGEYIGHLQPTIEEIEERERQNLQQIQMPQQCIVLLHKE